jgi:hypothetical protein
MVPGQINTSGAAKGATNQYAAPTATGYATRTNLYGDVPAYVVPSMNRENGYSDSPVVAWSAPLRSVPGGTPDPMRIGELKQRDYRPTPLTEAPEDWWLGVGGPGRESQGRHNSSEFVDADGMTELKGPIGAKRAAPDPRRTPPPESRPTQQLSPHRYVYTRSFDHATPDRFTGNHFSLADHRRNYTILGMAPVVSWRNTYRQDPAPWDVNIVDYPPSAQNAYTGAGGNVYSADVPLRSNRSGRLM